MNIPPISSLRISLGFATGFAAAAAAADPPAMADLPPAARTHFDRGVHAIEVRDWSLATRYFAEARKAAPDSPVVALNLGLAYAKAGREPLAIAWLNAFAEADPLSPQAMAARAETQRLHALAKAKLQSLFQAAAAAIAEREGDRGSGFYWLARSQAKAGLLDDAVATLKRSEVATSSYYGPRAMKESLADVLCVHAESCCEAGDFTRAAAVLEQVPATGVAPASLSGYGAGWGRVSGSHVAARDFDQAWRAANRIPDLTERGNKLVAAAELALLAGDFIPAEEALRLLKDDYDRSRLLSNIVAAALLQKDFDRANRTARQLHPDTAAVAAALVRVADAQAEAGDPARARAIAREVLGLGQPGAGIAVESAIAAYGITGEYERALQLAPRLKKDDYNPNFRYETLGRVIFWRAVHGGDLKGAERMTGALAQQYARGFPDDPFVVTDLFYAELAAAQVRLGRGRDAIATVKIPKAGTYASINYRITQLARALAEKGQLEEAQAMADVLRGRNDGQRDRAYRPIVRAHAARGDSAAVERIGSEFAPGNAEMWISAADGHRARGANSEAVSALRRAAQAVADSKPEHSLDSVNLPAWWWGDHRWHRDALRVDLLGRGAHYTVTPEQMLARIAELQAALGDATAAKASPRRLRGAVAGPWVRLIDSPSFAGDEVQLDRVLDEVRASKSPEDIVSKLTEAAEKYGRSLLRVQALEQQLAAAEGARG